MAVQHTDRGIPHYLLPPRSASPAAVTSPPPVPTTVIPAAVPPAQGTTPQAEPATVSTPDEPRKQMLPESLVEVTTRHGWRQLGISRVGLDHFLGGKNNQDSFLIVQQPSYQLAIVSDGCGSAKNSEVGSRLGLQLLARSVHDALQQVPVANLDWTAISQDYTHKVLDIINASLDARKVHHMFFSTFVLALIDEHDAVFVMCGDGVVAVNGRVVVDLEYSMNAPPFLPYHLFTSDGWMKPYKPEDTILHIVRQVSAKDLQSFWVATDGVQNVDPDVRDDFCRQLIDGTSPAALLDEHHADLYDDTTLVLGTRSS